MNRHRFHSNMEAAWELRPMTDETPGSAAHPYRFISPKKNDANAKKSKQSKENKQ